MTCRVAERRLSQSLDRPLDRPLQDALDAHLAVCGTCRALASDLRALRGRMADPRIPEPLPDFWGRLERRINALPVPAAEARAVWARWSLRAIPASLALIAGFVGAMLFFLPPQTDVTTQQALLFGEENPIVQTPSIIEEKSGTREIAILFAADERLSGRYRP